jgi:hypothetical protein
VGRCVPYKLDQDCKKENQCSFSQQPINEADKCPEKRCSASDCQKCIGEKDANVAGQSCIWTRQVLRSSGFWPTLHMMPLYNWNCIRSIPTVQSSTGIVSSPPSACPTKCHEMADCKQCLASSGAEGGWHECRWAPNLKKVSWWIQCARVSNKYWRSKGEIWVEFSWKYVILLIFLIWEYEQLAMQLLDFDKNWTGNEFMLRIKHFRNFFKHPFVQQKRDQI